MQEQYNDCLYLFILFVYWIGKKVFSAFIKHGSRALKLKWQMQSLPHKDFSRVRIYDKNTRLGNKHATICLAKDNAGCRENKGKTFPGWEVPSHLYLGNRQCLWTANFLEDFFSSVGQILSTMHSCYDFNAQLIFSSEEKEKEGGSMIMR